MKDVQGIFDLNKIPEIFSVNFNLEYRCATTRLGARLYRFLD